MAVRVAFRQPFLDKEQRHISDGAIAIIALYAPPGGGPVGWIDEQDNQTRLARLLVATPQQVYDELRAYAKNLEANYFGWDKDLENALLERNDPLIDLGLASFAAEHDVVASLYARAQGQHYRDERFRKGVRIACLSNEGVARRVLSDFPKRVIGDAETKKLLAEADTDEVGAVLRNSWVADDLLQALYERKNPFDSLPDKRWFWLVSLSWRNARLTTNRENESGPDLGLLGIQGAIFNLLEIAPVKPEWVFGLHGLLIKLDPREAAWPEPERLAKVLSRWASVEVKDEGHYTGLSLKEELRCLIGALYGRYYSQKEGGKGKSEIFGSADADDVAHRCAYYGRGTFDAKQIKQYQEREGDVFSFAVLCNTGMLMRHRRIIEEAFSGRWFMQLYQWRLDQIHRHYPNFDPRPMAEWLIDEDQEAGRKQKAELEQQNERQELVRRIGRIDRRVELLGISVILAAALAAAYYMSQQATKDWGFSELLAGFVGASIFALVVIILFRKFAIK